MGVNLKFPIKTMEVYSILVNNKNPIKMIPSYTKAKNLEI